MASRPSSNLPTRQPPFLKLRSGKAKAPLAPNSSASPKRSPRSIHPGVFTRLQSLLPPSLYFSQFPAAPTTPGTGASPLPPPPSLFLKTRIITWNMHDSLPKGNLEELLGAIPLHTSRVVVDDADGMRIPGLSLEDDHPYHIVVVAGQECPTLSGIPLGLAANFKHRDAKDRDKERERHREKDGEKDGEKDKDILQHTKHRLSKHLRHDHALHTKSPDSSHSFLAFDAASSHNVIPGWSAVLEDWFANGVGSLHDVKSEATGAIRSFVTAASSPIINEDQHGFDRNSHKPPLEPQSPGAMGIDLGPSNVLTDSNTSPVSDIKANAGLYELLVKERLMGIYTAMYIHKDVKQMEFQLVKRMNDTIIPGAYCQETGVVPAGLIGGRLGNKGGVGISINLYGTTLLFINAHLAAHEGKVPLRVANLAKIKTELPLESWLSPDDPRTLAEDITDRFDHSWIFGDLNFRLDISRLHADWLISHKEYSQAFGFDQLHKLMESGEATFSGFKEAKIDFPPTFKYDVMHTLKRDKHKLQKNHKDIGDDLERETGDKDDDDDEEQDDIVSLHSSAWTSVHSKHHTDPIEDRDDQDASPSSSPGGVGLTHSPSTRLVARAALKAKATWMAFLESSRDSSPATDSPRSRRQTSAARLGIPQSSIELSHEPNANVETPSLLPVLRRAASARGLLGQPNQEDNHASLEDDKGVYDSSSKQRVPSWCDRILWKSTIEPCKDYPHPEPETAKTLYSAPPQRKPHHGGHRFLKVLSPRMWRHNINSKRQADHPRSSKHPDDASRSNLSSLSTATNPSKFNGTAAPKSSGLYKSKSLEPSSGSLPSHLSASASVRSNASRRQSVPVYSRSSHAPPVPRRAETDKPSIHSTKDSPPSPTSPGRSPSKWWFLNLLSRDRAPLSPSADSGTSPPPPPPPAPQHQKGDVVCLSYRTLDDHQMRRLEGRSDHRPVIGSFAIYI